jgi:catechol 2,3-dioxygenase-like lactoylglutathione lyase family enzyme
MLEQYPEFMARPPAFIDHIIIQVADLSRSLEFYRAALKPLGAEVTDVPGPPESWGPAVVLVEGEPASALHLAFVASDPEAVRNFHAAALASGGRDNGPPGLRERYNPHYYAAFVIDPDGHNIEAVFQGP